MTKRRILILDDDESLGETLANYVKSIGEEQRYTSNLTEFYQLFDQWLPDIVLIDLKLQGSDGVSAFRELALRKTQALIIVMSGAGQKILESASDAARERGLNVVGILNKPFALGRLKELLQYAIPETAIPRADKSSTILFKDLQQAIANNNIRVMLQPKFSSKTRTLTGFEALARWQHTRLGDITPDNFIAKAESWDLIDDLTQVVFEQSASWFAAFTKSLKGSREYYHLADTLTLAVNLSAKSLANDSLFDWIYACCDQYGLTAHRVVFELTESSAMQDVAASLDNLTRIRLRGFSLSLDDFGSGYSSLFQLVRLPFSEIKIDKSFVISSEHSSSSRSVIQAAVFLAASMGMRVTAEGVETEQALELMSKLGCDLIQGYYTGRPMYPEAIEPWFREREFRRRQKQVDAAIHVNQINFSDNNKIIKIAQLVAAMLEVPTVVITSLEESTLKMLFKVRFEYSEIPRDASFCTIAITSDKMFVVENASTHEIFKDNELVTREPGIRFYAGKSYFVEDGVNIGALCAIDYKPRQISATQEQAMTVLADILGREISRESSKGYIPRAKFSDMNIRRFREQAVVLWEYCSRMATCELGVIMIKLTGLERINCLHGRDVGDKLIGEANDMLTANSGLMEVGGRYRGAYFALLTIKRDDDNVNQTANSLLSRLDDWRLNHPMGLHELDFAMSFHICIAELGSSIESTLEDAIDYTQEATTPSA